MGLLLTGCAATTSQIIPTARPSPTPTLTAAPTDTPDRAATLTAAPSATDIQPTAGPSPTSLFGPTRTPLPGAPTATNPPDLNAPRIEYFSSDSDAVAPGGTLTLFWSTQNVDRAVIYRLDRAGERTEVINVNPAGNYTYQTRRADRGEINFVLIAEEQEAAVQQRLTVPLACPIAWFFGPPPTECPNDEAVETTITEQTFERGRMIYIAATNQIYVLFNDENDPAWIQFDNRYDPAIHPESLENFPGGPGTFQPIAELGFVWRGNDTVRNRLGLGTTAAEAFDGFLQDATLVDGNDALYISSTNATVLELLPRGGAWQLITAPQAPGG
jgi:hypothetical protein